MSVPALIVRSLSAQASLEPHTFTRAFTVGRAPDSDVQIVHPLVSRTHLLVTPTSTGWAVSPGTGPSHAWIHGFSRVSRDLCRVRKSSRRTVIRFGELRCLPLLAPHAQFLPHHLLGHHRAGPRQHPGPGRPAHLQAPRPYRCLTQRLGRHRPGIHQRHLRRRSTSLAGPGDPPRAPGAGLHRSSTPPSCASPRTYPRPNGVNASPRSWRTSI